MPTPNPATIPATLTTAQAQDMADRMADEGYTDEQGMAWTAALLAATYASAADLKRRLLWQLYELLVICLGEV